MRGGIESFRKMLLSTFAYLSAYAKVCRFMPTTHELFVVDVSEGILFPLISPQNC